jgi:hypothetical protein
MKRKKNVTRYVRMTARQLRAASRLRQRNGRDEVPPPDSRGARLVGENPPTAGAPAPRTRRQSHLREPYQELLAKSDVLARKFGISRALLIERSNAVSKLYWRMKGACKRFGHRTKQYKSASGEPRARGSGQLVGFPKNLPFFLRVPEHGLGECPLGDDVVLAQELFRGVAKCLFGFDFSVADFSAKLQIPVLGDPPWLSRGSLLYLVLMRRFLVAR